DDPATTEADHVWKSSVVARIELLPFGKDFGVGLQGSARRTRELDPDNTRQRKNLLQNLRGYLAPRAFRKEVGVELLLRGRGESFAIEIYEALIIGGKIVGSDERGTADP